MFVCFVNHRLFESSAFILISIDFSTSMLSIIIQSDGYKSFETLEFANLSAFRICIIRRVTIWHYQWLETLSISRSITRSIRDYFLIIRIICRFVLTKRALHCDAKRQSHLSDKFCQERFYKELLNRLIEENQFDCWLSNQAHMTCAQV